MTPTKDDCRWNEDLVTSCADAVVLARSDGGDASDAIRQFASMKKLQVTPEAAHAINSAADKIERSATLVTRAFSVRVVDSSRSDGRCL